MAILVLVDTVAGVATLAGVEDMAIILMVIVVPILVPTTQQYCIKHCEFNISPQKEPFPGILGKGSFLMKLHHYIH